MTERMVERQGYKALIDGMSSEDKDALHEVYCNSTVTITQLAVEHGCSIAVMR